jgi:hypothetical protein
MTWTSVNTVIKLSRTTLTNFLQVLGTANNGSYTWVVSRSLPSAQDYVLQITADDEINYSMMFGVANDGSDDTLASGTSHSSASPASSTGGSAGPTSSPTASSGNSQSGQSIGVGALIGALLLAFGAFFLGMSGRKKLKRATIIDTESGSAGEKPELDGKAACHEITEDGAVPSSKVFELAGHLGQATVMHTELDAEPRSMEIDSSEVEPPRHELHANTAASPASPTSDPQHTGPTGRNTNDDSRLVGEFAGTR